MHRRPLIRAFVAMLILLGAAQGAAGAIMPLLCCGGSNTDMHGNQEEQDVSLHGAMTMQAGDDCGVTCSVCAVCHSAAAVPSAFAQAANTPSLRLLGFSVESLPFAPEPFHRPPRTSGQ
jgi:hypothetical protein